jgi:four helix bundle protein
MDLVVRAYHVSRDFPPMEQHALTAQLQRASVTVAARIAEGHGREHTGEFIHQLAIASSALMEVETLLQIAERLAYVTPADSEAALRHCEETSRMLSGLMKSLKRKQ